MATRKQLIEHKLQYLQTPAGQTAGSERADVVSNKSSLLKELAELTRTIEIAIRDYEQAFGERFVVNNSTVASAVGVAVSAGSAPGSGRSVLPRKNSSPLRTSASNSETPLPNSVQFDLSPGSAEYSFGSPGGNYSSVPGASPPVTRPSRGTTIKK